MSSSYVHAGTVERRPAGRCGLPGMVTGLRPESTDGRPTIDLPVVSPIDHDPVGAARRLLDDREPSLECGAIFGHPHDEALARVVACGGARPMLWFNHDASALGDRVERWPGQRGTAQLDGRVELPAQGQEGIILPVAGRRTSQGPLPRRPRRLRRRT